MLAYSQATYESKNPTFSFAFHNQLSVCESSPPYESASTADPVPTHKPVIAQASDGLSLHESIQQLFRIGNRVRVELIAALRTLHEEKLYLELGYSSFIQYCQRELGVGKSTAYEWIRTGIQLDQLPGTRSLHEAGDLSWEQVRELTKVATAETERDWVDFAHESTNKELRAEVKDAVAAGRETPRSREHGLPNVTTRLTIDVTREERERLLTALAIVAEQHQVETDTIAESSVREAETPSGDSTKDSLFKLVDAVLSGQLVAAETPNRTSYQSVVYHHCPQCQDSTVSTDEGPVEISPRRFDHVREDAKVIRVDPAEAAPAKTLPESPDGEIDPSNSTRLVRQVLSRDSNRCANPGCGSRHQLQAHHIVFRADGGRTVLANEVAVCSTCHALIHEGLLEVTGSAARSTADLKWTPRCRRGENTAAIESMWQKVGRFPHAESAARTPSFPRRRPATDDGSEANALNHGDLDHGDRKAWIRTLRSMGFSAEEARESVHEAVERIERSGFTATDATVIKTVFDRDR